jgi:predicted outer membrane repeat protein
MTSMRGLAGLGLLLCAGIFADACGRTGLDLGGPEDVPVTTGAAGHATATGAAGAASEGAAGASAGPGEAGAPGTTGAAGSTTTAGAAGATMTGAAGGPGMTGAAGATAVPPPMRIPCGAETCTFGTQTCCARLQNGAPTASCIAATDSCQGGLSFSCSNTAECGGGAVCCVSTRSLSTTCEQPVACVLSPGIILCNSDADCPGLLGNCCGGGNMKICGPRACNGGRGMGGGRPGR